MLPLDSDEDSLDGLLLNDDCDELDELSDWLLELLCDWLLLWLLDDDESLLDVLRSSDDSLVLLDWLDVDEDDRLDSDDRDTLLLLLESSPDVLLLLLVDSFSVLDDDVSDVGLVLLDELLDSDDALLTSSALLLLSLDALEADDSLLDELL